MNDGERAGRGSQEAVAALGGGGPVSHSLVVGIVVVAALYFGQDVFVPLALAVLLSLALGPVVLAFRRARMGRVTSVAAAVLLAFVMIFGVSALIGTQISGLANNLPRYQQNISDKISSIRHATAGAGLMQRAAEVLHALRQELTRAGAEDELPPAVPATPADILPSIVPPTPAEPAELPIPVQIFQPQPGPLEMIQNIAAPLLHPLSKTLVVLVFVVMFLLKREDLRDRFIRLAGAHDLRRTTEALDDATRRLSRYLLVQSAINASFATLITLGLWIIGVPNPLLWGVMAGLLRFVPYIGPIIAAAFPAALAVAVDPGWSMLFWTLALFFTAEPIVGQVIEPWIYGHNTGLSAVAIVIAAVFWTWLWGLVGLLLSTPLTVCLVVLGRHVEHLKFLDVLLGDRPALAPEESFYQRLLAGDPDEAADQAEQFLKTRRLADYYDEVAIKGLALAQVDRVRGGLDHQRRNQIKDAVYEIIDDLADHDDAAPPAPGTEKDPAAAQPPAIAPAWQQNAVMCVAGRGAIDEASAAILAHLLSKHGVGARVISSPSVSASNIFKLDIGSVQLAVICFMEAESMSNARFLVRRLRRLGHARIVLGFWTLGDDEERRRAAIAATGVDDIVTSLREAVDHVVKLAQVPAEPAALEQRAPVAAAG